MSLSPPLPEVTPVYDVLPHESVNAALWRLGFVRDDCMCARCAVKSAGSFERRRVVRVSDDAEALPCRTPVRETIEWIRKGCPMPEARA